MHFIRIFVLMALCLFTIEAYASPTIEHEQVDTDLVIYTTDGSRTIFKTSGLPFIVFSDDSMIISDTEITAEYPLDNIIKIVYEPSDKEANGDTDDDTPPIVTGIDDAAADSAARPFIISREQLIFPGLQNTTIGVYTVDGRQIISHKALAGVTPVIPISHLSSGVYLIVVNNITYKIILR